MEFVEFIAFVLSVIAIVLAVKMRARVIVLEQHVTRLEQRPAPDAPKAAPAAEAGEPQTTVSPLAQAPAPSVSAPLGRMDEGASEKIIQASARPSPPAPPPAPPPPPAPGEPTKSFEERFGASWVVWIGGLALALGGIFMVQYSIEAGLIGPGVRVFLGGLLATALVAAGEWTRRNQFS